MSSTASAVICSEDARVGRGLAAAAVVGWALIAASLGLALFGPTLQSAVSFASYVYVTALFGLPLSFMTCYGAGLAVWMMVPRRRWIRRRDAAGVGAIVGIVLAFLFVAITLLPSLVTRIIAARLGVDDVLQVALIACASAVYLAPIGVIAGLAAWRAGGRKSAFPDKEAAA